MKNFLPIAIVCILLLNGIGAVALPEDDHEQLEKSFSLYFSKPIIKDEGEYLSLYLDESNLHITESGKPMLPMYVKTIDLPFGVTDIDICCTVGEIHELKVTKSIISTPESKPLTNIIKLYKESKIDNTIYSSNDLYPNMWYSYRSGCGLNNDGEHVTHVAIQIYPVRYSLAASKLCYIESIDIKVTYDAPSETATFADNYDLVIITPRRFSIFLNRLVSHKNKFGINTTLETIENIYKEYSGVDKPEQIKYFIKDAIEQLGVKYVLLVGGLKRYWDNNDKDNCNEGSSAWHFPVRYTNLYDDDYPEMYDPGFISDLYYADVYKGGGAFENWDSNSDGIFAAYDKPGVPNDVLDLYPDICVGRLSCRNLFEVMIIVNKIINYEKSAANPTWFDKIVCIAGDTFPSELAYEGEVVCDEAISAMGSIEAVRIYASYQNSGMGDTPSPDNITAAVSDGCGFLLFEGHGSAGTWGTRYPSGENTPPYLVYHFPKLKNGKKLPVTVIGGCHDSLFNVSIQKTYGPENKSYWSYGLPLPECFSWWLTRKINGGSIATIGCTALEYGIADFPLEGLGGYMDYLFFWAYGQIGKHVLGETWSTALTRYIDDSGLWGKTDVKMIEIWTLLGDPSLMIGGYS